MTRFRQTRLRQTLSSSLMLATMLLGWPSLNQSATAQITDEEKTQLNTAVSRGAEFLKSSQNADGTWTSSTSLGISAIATHALLVSGVPVEDPAVQNGLQFLLDHVQPDGGIYHPSSFHRNYESSLAILALVSANADGRYEEQIQKTVEYLKAVQWDEEEVGSRQDVAFGGAGYGRHSRPDLSNTTFFLEALEAAGVPPHDAAVQDALVFVSRCQNLDSPYNQTPHADKINDGGFYYTAAAGGSSQAGNTPEGGLRSYASMTYAGLKSMIYAGVAADDPRVVAAEKWIKQFYTLNENPGMGAQGQYYYYQVFAKALEAVGKEQFVDADGASHDWRADLRIQLLERQQEDGSWINTRSDRWLENDPNLVTAYSLIALSRCGDPSPQAR